MRILVLANLIPEPPDSGARIRLHHLLRRVSERHEITLACHLWDPEIEGARVREAEAYCRRVVAREVLAPPLRRLVPASVVRIARGEPPEFALRWSESLAAAVGALAKEVDFDLVQVEEHFMVPYLRRLPSSSTALRAVTLHNIGSVQSLRFARIGGGAVRPLWHLGNVPALRRWERRELPRFDRVIVVSEEDRRRLAGAVPGLDPSVVPNGVDTDALRPLPEAEGPPSFLFVGDMNYGPCADGARYFARRVFPRIRREIGDARFWIVGRDPRPEVRSLEGEGVRVTGGVPDVKPYYERCRALVVPLRAGGGTRIKILESMALGRPVVSTSIGAEGLELQDGLHYRRADGERALADSVLRVVRDPEGSRRMAARARRFVEERCDWKVAADAQLRVYEELAARRKER